MPAPAVAAGAAAGSLLTGGTAYGLHLWDKDSTKKAEKVKEEKKTEEKEKSAKPKKTGGGGGGPGGPGGAWGAGKVDIDQQEFGGDAQPGDEEDPFAHVPEPQGDLWQTRPMKFEDLGGEAREMCMDNVMEFQEGLVVNLSKPIVAPPGTPPPPQGPGAHRNYQAQMMERFVLNNAQTSHATFSIQSTFRQDQKDALSCTYNTQGTWNGLVVRSFGPCDLVAQWMQQPHGMGVGLFASGDVKHEQGVTSFTFIRQQYLLVQHLQGLWRNFYLGSKMRYDPMERATFFGVGLRWAAPNKQTVLSGEWEDSGSVKLSCVKKAAGLADTTFCCQYEYGGLHRPDYYSACTVSFMREYLERTRVRLAVNSDFQVRSIVEMAIGRVGNCSYNIKYDPAKKSVAHGLTFQM